MTKTKKPAKRVNTTKKSKPNAKEQAPKSAQEPLKADEPLSEHGENVTGKTENVPQSPTYRQLLNRLPAKRARFVEEYLVDLNTTRAAKSAGYSEHTAMKQGVRLLHFVAVKAAVEAGKAEISKRINITQDQVVQELALIGFANMADFIKIDDSGFVQAIPLETLADGKSRIIKKVKEKRVIRTTKGTESNPDGDQILDATFEFELCDKVKSLELLARHLGLLHDKTEVDMKQPLMVITKDFYVGADGMVKKKRGK